MAKARHVPYRRHGSSFWAKTIAEQRRSGLSQAEFCRQEGLTLSTFHRWRSRLAETADPEMPPDFVAIEIVDRHANANGEKSTIELVLPSGLTIRVPPRFDVESLVRVLWAVEATRPC